MFLLILTGILCYRIRLISVSGSKEMSSLLLQVVNPVIIFMAYQRQFSRELLNGLIVSLILSVAAFAVSIAVSYAAVRKKNGREYDIERFSCIYSNCAFMGIPLINALLGMEGVFYLTAFLTVFNLLVWTHGVILISGVRSMKSIIKAFRSPSVIAIFAGLVSFLMRAFISPEISDAFQNSVFYRALGYLSELNTPLAMIVAGCSIAQVNIKKAIGNPRVYFVTLIKLFVIPVILVLLFSLISLPQSPVITVITAMAAPTATMGTLLALTYERNYVYCSELFAVTTILSVVSMPLVIALNTILCT